MPFYASTWTGTTPTAGVLASGAWEHIDLGRQSPPGNRDGRLAFVWTDAPVSGAGVWWLADLPDDELSNPTVNTLNATLGVDVPRRATLQQAVRLVFRHYPAKFCQPPIDNDGMVRIVCGDLVDVFNQGDDPTDDVIEYRDPAIPAPPPMDKGA